MPRNIHVQLIVHPGKNSAVCLNDVVAQFLTSKGFKVTLPHIYPEDPMIIECVEELPEAQY